MDIFKLEKAERLPAVFRRLREERHVSQLQVADSAGVRASVVHRAERGADAQLSTWVKLFHGLGYVLLFDFFESGEEAQDAVVEEAAARRERRFKGLCAANAASSAAAGRRNRTPRPAYRGWRTSR